MIARSAVPFERLDIGAGVPKDRVVVIWQITWPGLRPCRTVGALAPHRRRLRHPPLRGRLGLAEGLALFDRAGEEALDVDRADPTVA